MTESLGEAVREKPSRGHLQTMLGGDGRYWRNTAPHDRGAEVSDLDDAEQRAIDMIRFFQEQCHKQCEPYVNIIAQIRSLRPRPYVVDGETLVPITPAREIDAL